MGDWSGVQVSTNATNELKDQLEAVGIRVAIIDLMDDTQEWNERQSEGLFMFRNCHAAELDLWTYPDWVFPVRDSRAWPMEGKWYQTGGAEGWAPQPGSPAYDLQALYRQGLAEPDEEERHKIVWDAIDIHIQQGPFTIGASGDQAMPVVVKNGFHGVPAEVILGPWAPGSPGNLHSEQFWMDKSLNPNLIYLPLAVR
jgi:peptide/nickel transport system substrate-binding protein